jgi:hypothetical protein
MWDHLLRISHGCSILHVGDNEHSDVQLPSDLGIANYHVMSAKNLFLNSMLGRVFPSRVQSINWLDAAMVGVANQKLFNDPFRLNKTNGNFVINDPVEFGYSVVGPVVFSYVLWLINSAVRDNVDTIYFLAREGYLLKSVFDSMVSRGGSCLTQGRTINSVYLLTSRRATIVAAIETLEDAHKHLDTQYIGSLHNLLEVRFGLPRKILLCEKIENRNIKLPEDRSKIEPLIANLFDTIVANATRERLAYQEYLQQQFKEGDRIKAVADLGYSATIQKSMSRIIGESFYGYYFATHYNVKDNDQYNNKFYGCFVESDDPELTDCAVYKYSLVLESILTAPNGQLVCFRDEGGNVSPVFGPQTGDFKAIEPLHSGIKSYCDDMMTYYGRYLTFAEPNKQVSQYFLDNVMSNSFVGADLAALLRVEDRYCSDSVISAI